MWSRLLVTLLATVICTAGSQPAGKYAVQRGDLLVAIPSCLNRCAQPASWLYHQSQCSLKAVLAGWSWCMRPADGARACPHTS